jgi:hypothetical protein
VVEQAPLVQERLARLEGFDMFWCIWSLTHADTILLGGLRVRS